MKAGGLPVGRIDVGSHVLGEASAAGPQLPAAYEPVSVLWLVGFATWPESRALKHGCEPLQQMPSAAAIARYCAALAPLAAKEISFQRTFCSMMV